MPQYLLPQHTLSRLMCWLTRCETVWFKNLFIRFIIAKYQVNMSEAVEQSPDAYPSFNAFFTRSLRDGVRLIEGEEKTIISPVDGAISQLGQVNAGQLIQAKGRQYSLLELLGGDEALATEFEDGQFATIYLSPRDYHRIHMPLTGTLRQMTYVPGKLFSVSPRTARAVPNLFSRNERLITVFNTDDGPMIMVLVGAIFVGSMETVWQGQITPPYGKEIQQWDYQSDATIKLQKGEEMGRFNMGSTVVLLLPKGRMPWQADLHAESPVKLGQTLI